jgi:hypothetical protein
MVNDNLDLRIEQKILSLGSGNKSAWASILIKIERPGYYVMGCSIPPISEEINGLTIMAQVTELGVSKGV